MKRRTKTSFAGGERALFIAMDHARAPRGGAGDLRRGCPSAPPADVVTCGASTTVGCTSYCQIVGDCIVENATVRPVLESVLTDLGFEEGSLACGGCVEQCAADVATTNGADEPVLACFDAAYADAVCGPGVQGAKPVIDAVNACCANAADSAVCTRLCGSLNTAGLSGSFFPSCTPFP